MTDIFNWLDHNSKRYKIPVDDLTRFKAFDTPYADCYNAEGALHKPRYWCGTNYDQAHAIYIEFDNVSRVYHQRSGSLFSAEDISKRVDYVHMLSLFCRDGYSCPPKGIVIMTYIPRQYRDMYSLESGAYLFLSHRHPRKNIRAQPYINANYMDYFEMNAGIKNYTTKYPQAEAQENANW